MAKKNKSEPESECNHIFRAVSDRSSQCAKCGLVVSNPDPPEGEKTLTEDLKELLAMIPDTPQLAAFQRYGGLEKRLEEIRAKVQELIGLS